MCRLFRFYHHWLCRGCRRGWGALTAAQRMALLLQVTQWQIRDMDEEDYRRWL
ncbi:MULTISPECIES: glucose uptake inhibitor SgrT [Dickeya]|uniref:Glucose uptake inhibitor SgrT n=1 Tax=Dickeya fangzhongdai TaxID=1778540 RepID=A0A2K8QQR5_9GAMM|nr:MULTISPECIES: glucose uptake inhibitor SgrT [Dickeya]ATZ95869.1 glucose uptake inhibitor SgrT [Dickeya fangzhongdai]MBO8132966.1 glucose uptake inhibitor SgrT [Dickeya fangzhongdai]QOH49312.1 glucose uptake inhibitor SgrT [Dickeya fangzhongdai]QOH53616.1 glucose uptake inhibitor SgrT [Dickeya fangzhongdai]UGA50446.1 glucose uptake inhibitor SgrT [Dickeya fangzhongdai]